MPLNQPNLITRHEIHVRTELWKDHIYYLTHNPYKFPTNDSQGDFLPLPKRFSEIITEFKEEIQKQKDSQRPPEERDQAQERINEIYREIKAFIKERIEEVENYEIEISPDDLLEAESKQGQVRLLIQQIQDYFQNEINLLTDYPNRANLVPYSIKDLQPYLKETSFAKFQAFEKKFKVQITSIETIEEDLEREINLLEEWEELNQGQPLLKKEELETHLLKEQEKNQQNYLKQLKLGLTKKTVNQLQKFNQEYLNDNEEITELLEEWEEQRKILLDRKNICFILSDNDQHLKFTFQPPRGIFINLKDFLFYRNNIWYEVSSWERINHENAIITAQRSHFIHFYPQFFSQGANGIIHHSPKFGNKNEICQCPSFLESTDFIEFTSDWQPQYKLWKLKNFLGGTWRCELMNKPFGQIKKYTTFHTLDLEEATQWENPEFAPTTFFLLPDWYENGMMTGLKPNDIKFTSPSGTSLPQWVENAKMERGGAYEHLLKHVHVNYFWGAKKIHESTLDEMNLDRFKVNTRANPAGIMYQFQSNKVLFRYSEDLNFSLEADKMMGLALKMGTKLVDGLVKAFSLGTVDPKTEGLADSMKETSNKYLHSGEDDKAKDERQGERKKTLAAATSGIASAVLGSIPSILDASHTHANYSLAELALRFESIQFRIRLEFNRNLAERYQKTKGLKKNGNQPFNTKKIGNIFSKGYYKIIPNIFKGDRNGYFVSLFSKGVYLYEEHPDEYFLEPLESGKFERGVLNIDPVMTNTTIKVDLKTSIGRDDQTGVDGMSWVRKDSYCRGGGVDLFPQLIEKGRKWIKLDVPNHSEATCSYDYCTKAHGASWRFDASANWSGSATLKKGVQYEWYIHAFSSGQKDNKQFKGLDDGVTVSLIQSGDEWSLEFAGRIEISETVGNPDAIGGGTEIDDLEEIVPEMEDEQQTEGLENLEKNMEAEAEQQQQQEIQEELEPEPEAQKEEEKQEELEPEDEKTKEKTKERQRQKQKQKEDEEQQEPENSREGEK